MKEKFTIVVSILLLMTITEVFCQSIVQRDITWYSEQNTDLNAAVQLSASCRIVTHRNQTIDLIWGDTKTFSVVSVDGNWLDPNQEGSLLYHVKYQEVNGEITINRIANEITIVIDFTKEFAAGIREKFIINRFE